jgi:predicted  nucleic acid-binding Zn-ribbon protein
MANKLKPCPECGKRFYGRNCEREAHLSECYHPAIERQCAADAADLADEDARLCEATNRLTESGFSMGQAEAIVELYGTGSYA